MASKADNELSRTRELLEQLRAKNDSLQAEIDKLREENSALLKTNARQAILLQEQGGIEHGNTTVNGKTKEDLPPTGTVKKAHYSYISR